MSLEIAKAIERIEAGLRADEKDTNTTIAQMNGRALARGVMALGCINDHLEQADGKVGANEQ